MRELSLWNDKQIVSKKFSRNSKNVFLEEISFSSFISRRFLSGRGWQVKTYLGFNVESWFDHREDFIYPRKCLQLNFPFETSEFRLTSDPDSNSLFFRLLKFLQVFLHRLDTHDMTALH